MICSSKRRYRAGFVAGSAGSIASWLLPVLANNVVLLALGLVVWRRVAAGARAEHTVATYADFITALAEYVDLAGRVSPPKNTPPPIVKESADARRRFLAAKARVLLYGNAAVIRAVTPIGGADLSQQGKAICKAVEEMRAHVGASKTPQTDIERLMGIECSS